MRKDKKDRAFFEDNDKGFWQTFFDENHEIPDPQDERRNRVRLTFLTLFIIAVWFSRSFL